MGLLDLLEPVLGPDGLPTAGAGLTDTGRAVAATNNHVQHPNATYRRRGPVSSTDNLGSRGDTDSVWSGLRTRLTILEFGIHPQPTPARGPRTKPNEIRIVISAGHVDAIENGERWDRCRAPDPCGPPLTAPGDHDLGWAALSSESRKGEPARRPPTMAWRRTAANDPACHQPSRTNPRQPQTQGTRSLSGTTPSRLPNGDRF
jgi:hypothetical protein